MTPDELTGVTTSALLADHGPGGAAQDGWAYRSLSS